MTIQNDLSKLYQGTDVTKVYIPPRMSKLEKWFVITMFLALIPWILFFVWLIVIV